VTAHEIVALLAARHTGDVFVPECKDGPTVSAQHRRLDAWAMKRSWAHPKTSGYEVKVSRSDFLRDDKWRDYLPLCNELWFACPHGVIAPAEIPPEVGLLVASNTGSRLFIKKRAPFREIAPPVDLMIYVLMSRTRISANEFLRDRFERGAVWAEWLNDRKALKEIGYRVSTRVTKHVRELERANGHLAELIKNYEEIRARLVELGFNPEQEVCMWTINRKLEELREGLPREFSHLLDRCIEGLQKIKTTTSKPEDESAPAVTGAGRTE
jgi:Fe2+ transport system protein FeoA